MYILTSSPTPSPEEDWNDGMILENAVECGSLSLHGLNPGGHSSALTVSYVRTMI